MRTYKLEPANKKSITVLDVYEHENGDRLFVETLWRWGAFFVSVEGELVIDDVDDEVYPFDLSEDVDLDYLDDVIACDISIAHPDANREVTYEGDVIDNLHEVYAEEGSWGLEDLGWELQYSETVIEGGVEVSEC